MNREIKFRGWNTKHKTMGESFTLQTAIGSRLAGGIDTTEVTYMQFTGLLDRNGKEIYEGDILRYVGNNAHPIYGQYHLRIVEWDGSNFRWKFRKHPKPFAEQQINVQRILKNEIIGNIYQTPDLLK